MILLNDLYKALAFIRAMIHSYVYHSILAIKLVCFAHISLVYSCLGYKDFIFKQRFVIFSKQVEILPFERTNEKKF